MEKSDRSTAPAPSDHVPALVLSADGLVARRDPGAPELQDSALLAVNLAENIGSQLELPPFSALEVRLDLRQVMLLRRSDGGLEVRQLILPARLSERARWSGGADHPNLDSLRDVPGVHGSFVISDLGRLLGSDFPSLLDEATTAAVGLLVLRLSEVFPRADESLVLCTLRYGSQLLFLRAVQGGVLCVLAAATVSLPAARMAMTLVANRYNRAGGEPSGPKPAPLLDRTAMLVSATPVEPPEVHAVLAQAAALRPTGILWKLGIGVAAIGIGMVAVTIALTPLKRHRRAQLESPQVIITSSPTAETPPAAALPPPDPAPVAQPPAPNEPAPAALVDAETQAEPEAPRPAPRRALAAFTDDGPARITNKRRPARRVLAAPAPGRAFSLGNDPPPRPRRPIDPRDPYALDVR